GSSAGRWIVPIGKKRQADSTATAPSRMSNAAISCVRSISVASRQIPRMTPFMTPTKGSRWPKSVVSVTIRPVAIPFENALGGAALPQGELAVAVDDEVGDEHQCFLVLGVLERVQGVLGGLSVFMGALER